MRSKSRTLTVRSRTISSALAALLLKSHSLGSGETASIGKLYSSRVTNP